MFQLLCESIDRHQLVTLGLITDLRNRAVPHPFEFGLNRSRINIDILYRGKTYLKTDSGLGHLRDGVGNGVEVFALFGAELTPITGNQLDGPPMKTTTKSGFFFMATSSL